MIGIIGLFLPALLNAQQYAVDRGVWQVSGSAGFQSSETEIEGQSLGRSTTISLVPSVMYFVSAGLAVGGELGLARSSFRGNTQTLIGVGPAATYYFGRSARTWYPFIGASVSVSRNHPESGDDLTEWRYKGGGGLLFLLSTAVGVNSELFYETGRQTSDGETAKGNRYGLAFGISAFVS
jgi:hypothetical protein